MSGKEKRKRPTLPRKLSLLDSGTRKVVRALLSHASIKRLQRIGQLGFVRPEYARDTRWDHLVASIDLLAELLDVYRVPDQSIVRHILAALIFQHAGHAPFSNSLREVFAFQPSAGAEHPADIYRSLLMVEEAERSESVFSQIGLSTFHIRELLIGRSPWPSEPWVEGLLSGPLDLDRLTYVDADTEATDVGDSNAAIDVARRLRFDRAAPDAVVERGAADAVRRFIVQRTTLYAEVYLSSEKIACEVLAAECLRLLWAELPETGPPRTIEEFLSWDDAKILKVLTIGRLAPNASERLRQLARSLLDGGYFVASVGERLYGGSPGFLNIDERLFQLRMQSLSDSDVRFVLSSELPKIVPFEFGRILEASRSHVASFEASNKEFLGLATALRRRPLVIAPESMINAVYELLNGQDLEMRSIKKIAGLTRRRATSAVAATTSR